MAPSVEPKHVLAALFFTLGGWALLAPAHVLRLTMLRPEVTDVTVLLTACFGSQAVMNGVLFATARMTRAAYIVSALHRKSLGRTVRCCRLCTRAVMKAHAQPGRLSPQRAHSAISERAGHIICCATPRAIPPDSRWVFAYHPCDCWLWPSAYLLPTLRSTLPSELQTTCAPTP